MAKHELHEKARMLRIENRLSVKCIAKELGVARSTVSLWVRDIPLNEAEKRERLSQGARALNESRGILPLVVLPCLHCGVEIRRKRIKSNVFCSVLCASKYRESVGIQAIFKVGSAQGFGIRSTKKAIRFRDGSRCRGCKLEEWMGSPIPLTLDHIDGNPENWALSNLRLVCPNCDALSPTFAGRNRGNGRYYRRKRYAEGKSF